MPPCGLLHLVVSWKMDNLVVHSGGFTLPIWIENIEAMAM
jgi:hypothetical protein